LGIASVKTESEVLSPPARMIALDTVAPGLLAIAARRADTATLPTGELRGFSAAPELIPAPFL